MKIRSVVALLLSTILPAEALSLQGSDDLDDRFGHVNPSCKGRDITEKSTLADLISLTTTGRPVSIDCGYLVTAKQGQTYEMPDGLEVFGTLVFEDTADENVEATIVESPYILVRGHLQAGTPDKPYQSKLHFVLTEFRNKAVDHYNLTIASESTNPLFNSDMNLGDKAFVVYGGSVSLCGPLEGDKIIGKLAKTVKQGATSVFVKGDWSNYWKSGDRLAIAGTLDRLSNRGNPGGREFTIQTSWYKKKMKLTHLKLSEEFMDPTNENFVKKRVMIRTYKGKVKKVIKTAEIFKLTRNIVIQGIPVGGDMTNFIGPNLWDLNKQPTRGGHFVVAHTPKKQIIQGVEFSAMGQAGIHGRYPIHFHSCGNIDTNTILQHNSVHHSKHRCVVVHATNGLTVEKNSAFFTHDHCFMTEDGYEHGNTFRGNIAVNVERAAFWMANPSNDLMYNVAANAGAGFDISEFEPQFEGDENFSMKHEIPCQKLEGEDSLGCTLSRFLPMGIFRGNVAHNVEMGIQIYPPRYASYPQRMDDMDVLENFFAWNVYMAYHSVSSNMELINFRVIGANIGINIDSGSNIWIKESSFQDVCKGVTIAETRWNALHSGVEVNKVAFHRIWEEPNQEPDSCAPLVFIVYNPTNKYFGKVTTQLVNLKLYEVERLFSFQDDRGIIGNINTPYGFFVYNVLSFKSQMKHIAPAKSNGAPSYVVRHGYPGTLDDTTSNSLVNSCEESVIGGYPINNEFFVCKAQCWRPIIIIFKQVLGNNIPVSIKFVSDSGSTFFLSESPNLDYMSPDNYIHAVQVIPAAKYEIFLVNGKMKELSKQLHNKADVRFYHGDQRYKGFETQPKNYGCLDNVILEFNGKELMESDLSDIPSSYPAA